jgi:transposase
MSEPIASKRIGRPPKVELRPLSLEERTLLERIARSRSERADVVSRARCLLVLADGATFTEAARATGRRSSDAIAGLVRRFSVEGVSAVKPRYRGRSAVQYGPIEKERVLREFRRKPDPDKDGTATWSLATLQRALQNAPDGLPKICTQTILRTLHEAGYTWQKDRTWCETGQVQRKRKEGVVTVTDPRTAEKRG